MKTVVYMRTNLIKHAISSIHADVLVKACDTHKVLSQKAKDCVESNTEVISQKIAVDALSLSKSARKLGRYWVSLLLRIQQKRRWKGFLSCTTKRCRGTLPIEVRGGCSTTSACPVHQYPKVLPSK